MCFGVELLYDVFGVDSWFVFGFFMVCVGVVLFIVLINLINLMLLCMLLCVYDVVICVVLGVLCWWLGWLVLVESLMIGLFGIVMGLGLVVFCF